VLTLTPGVDFDLDLVNARIRDGTIHKTQFRLPPLECHSRCSDTEVQSFWCFLLVDLSLGVQTAARAPFCPSLQISTGSQREGVPS